MQIKSSDRGFTLAEMLVTVIIVGVLSYFGSAMFVDQDSSQKRLSSRIELIDLRQSISTHLDCKETLGPFPSCNGPVVLKRKNKKEIKLKKNSPYKLNAGCKTDPMSGEKSIIISLLENKDPSAKGAKKDALTRKKIENKKRGEIIEEDIFNGTSSFCSKYFEKPEDRNEPEWHYAGSYALTTYEGQNKTKIMSIDPNYYSSLEIDKFKSNNNPKVRPRCEKIFKNCKNDCEKKGKERMRHHCPIQTRCPESYCCGAYHEGKCTATCTRKVECANDRAERLKCESDQRAQRGECKKSCQPSLNQCIASANGNSKPCRHINPATGACSCPSPDKYKYIEEVREQISWSMTNKVCDHGYYADPDRFPGIPDSKILSSGPGKSCFKFEVADVGRNFFKTGYTCNFDSVQCPDHSQMRASKIYNYPKRGPTRQAFAVNNLCKDGAMMPGNIKGKWFGCGLTQVACYIKLKRQ